jgi:ATP-binding cassette subfamily F protein uup
VPLLTLDKISLAFGHLPLLDGATAQFEAGERVCVLGRNGSGKSTLMRILSGEQAPDAGTVWRQPTLRAARLDQDVPLSEHLPVFDVVAGGLGDVSALVTAYHQAAVAVAHDPSPAALERLGRRQHDLEERDGWRVEQRVEMVLSRLNLPADAVVDTLSGGWRRRVLLARALVAQPDLLLLDEPTNHLDIDAIAWLEEFLAEYQGAVVFVTHDRAFLQRLATRIVELDRGRLTSWPGDYANYLRRQEERAADEAHRAAQADKLLAKEEVWVRKGLKAQRNRNQSRVEELERLRRERRERRDPTGSVRLAITEAERSGRLVIEALGLAAGHGSTAVVRDLELLVVRGDRLGIVGPNGSGKTTLVRTLLGDLPPLAGTVRRGTNLRTIWFDPLNAALDPERSVVDTVADGADQIDIDGRRRHVVSYLADFLFPADRARQPVKKLSGGERARLLLARLFAQPSNLLVLDEPTNDLDAETLEVLEDALMAYPGTVIVVSHDRDFLDETVNGLLVLDGRGGVREVVGGWSEWERVSAAAAPAVPAKPAAASRAGADHRAAVRDRREVERLERKIAALEDEQRALHVTMEEASFWTGPAERVAATQARLAEVEREVAAAYERWTSLQG